MKVIVIDDSDQERAKSRLKSDLGINESQFRLVKTENRRCTFEVFSCPPSIEVEVSRDGMKAFLKRLRLPIGPDAPKLTTDLLTELLKQKGIVAGVKHDVLAGELFKILKTPGYDDEKILNILVAEGSPPVSGRAGRPQMLIDLNLFKQNAVIFARKGEVLARSPSAVKGQEGFRVTGEKIPPVMEEQFKLSIGAGIEVRSSPEETVYVTKSFGRLHYDQGIRLRLELKVVELREGLDAGLEIMSKSFSGARITGEDLVQAAQDANVSFGVLTPAEIEAQLKAVKKWPAVITVAKGKESVDGKAGEVIAVYKNPASSASIDLDRAKESVVFPGEDVMILKGARLPEDGRTAFGEVLRGRTYNELPIYPGRGIAKERRGDDIVFKSTTYGKVSVDKDRVNILNPVQVSKDGMEATLDLFPQKALSASIVLDMLREQDVLFGFDKDQLELQLQSAFKAGQRVPRFVVARGRGPTLGADAKLDFKFDPEDFKEKGLFQKKVGKSYFALPGDLLLVKAVPSEALDGQNVRREKIPVPKGQLPKDIPVNYSKNISAREIGEFGNPKDPRRIEYRAAKMGIVVWNNNSLDLKPTVSFSADEKEARIKFAPTSDFGTKLAPEMIQKIADEEGIRVELAWPEIQKALTQKREEDGELFDVVIARAVEPKHGESARIQYFVEFNGKPIESFLGRRGAQDPKPEILDFVRPGDVLAVKTPGGAGEDGKTIFGRRIPADRGRDEPFMFGPGIDKSKDGMQIFCNLSYPGYVVVEQGKIAVRSFVQVARDKMSASISIYPSKSARFALREDKVIAMIHGAGIKFGIKERAIREAIEEIIENGKPALNLVIAEGKKPGRGRDATFRYAIDLGDQVGAMREDGSIDFKSRNAFHSVKAGQILMIKQPPSMGEDGSDVYGNRLPGSMGHDGNLEAASGVELSANRLEYRALIDGILEVTPKVIRVIPGLLIPSDVGNKTGNINAGAVRVVVKGAVLPDFEVVTEKDLLIEKAAEACRLDARGSIQARGGIIGRGKAYVTADGDIEAFYISAEARVESKGNVIVGSEILHSKVVCRGSIECMDGAGVIFGGEIVAYRGLKCRVLGALGAETPTTVIMGEDRLGLREALQHIEESGLQAKIDRIKEQLKELGAELRSIYEAIPGAMKESQEKGQRLQEKYRSLYERRQESLVKAEKLEAERQAILAQYPMNPEFSLTVTDLIHPGTVICYQETQWVIKEPIRGVEIRWNPVTSNFTSRRI